MRETLGNWIESPLVARIVTWVILANAVILGMETSSYLMDRFGAILLTLDQICLAIFVGELAIKLFVHRLNFFKNGWNIFDFLVVGIALVPTGQGFGVLRALRILRVLRVISVAPSLRRVVTGFVTALPGMGSVFLLMAIIFYIGAVIATKLFASAFPEWFGTLGLSAYSLFQVMTLESWSMGIVRPVMEIYPYAWVFFVPFIMITTFAVVNLLVGLIVNSMQDAHAEEDDAKRLERHEDLLARLDRLEAMLAQQQATNPAQSSEK